MNEYRISRRIKVAYFLFVIVIIKKYNIGNTVDTEHQYGFSAATPA
jgi:hypothetical protein